MKKKSKNSFKSFSLAHLSSSEFEEFCYDLLGGLGFININWRKGTGLSASPSDKGRDIECQLEREDVDGNKYFEKWFIECKHYQKGVPPRELHNLINWANSERPNVALIIVSNFLSNPAKDYISDYQKNNNPPYRIKFWEKPDLEKLTISKAKLLIKYKIPSELLFLHIMHPAHLLYIKETPFNTLDYFFKILDKLDAQKRDKIMDLAYLAIIKPRFRKPITGKETLGELMIGEISYEIFKEKCHKLTDYIHPDLLVLLVVSVTLKYIFTLGDTTSIDEMLDRYDDTIEYFQSQIEMGDTKKEILESLIKMLQEKIKSFPDDTHKHYLLYDYFCENVVKELFKQPLIEVINLSEFTSLKTGGQI